MNLYSELSDQEQKEVNSKLMHLVRTQPIVCNAVLEFIYMGEQRHWFDEVSFKIEDQKKAVSLQEFDKTIKNRQ